MAARPVRRRALRPACRAPARGIARRAGRGQRPPLPSCPVPAPARGAAAGPAGRGAAGTRSGDRRRHRPPERATHRPGRAPDRLEVLPVPRAALHRDLPRPLVPRPAGAARGAERAHRRVQRGQGGGRPGLPVRRGRYRNRGFGAARQAGVLDGHRQRQDAAHARPRPPVPAPAHAPRPRPRPQPHPPAHAERRALAPAPARARDGGDRGGDLRQAGPGNGRPGALRRTGGRDPGDHQAQGRDGGSDGRRGGLRGEQPRADRRGASRGRRGRGRRVDALPQRALREGLLLRVLGDLRAGGQGQPRPRRPLCPGHALRLLLPLVPRRRLRQGLPDPEPRRRRRRRRGVDGDLAHRLPARVLPATTALPRARERRSGPSTWNARSGSSSAAGSPPPLRSATPRTSSRSCASWPATCRTVPAASRASGRS